VSLVAWVVLVLRATLEKGVVLESWEEPVDLDQGESLDFLDHREPWDGRASLDTMGDLGRGVGTDSQECLVP